MPPNNNYMISYDGFLCLGSKQTVAIRGQLGRSGNHWSTLDSSYVSSMLDLCVVRGNMSSMEVKSSQEKIESEFHFCPLILSELAQLFTPLNYFYDLINWTYISAPSVKVHVRGGGSNAFEFLKFYSF